MNPVDRLLGILAHQAVDRPPVIGVTNSVTLELMDAVGAKFPEAHHDPAQMMKLGAAAHEVCGLESVKVPFDMTVETGALGAEIDYGTRNTLPRATKPPFEDPGRPRGREKIMSNGEGFRSFWKPFACPGRPMRTASRSIHPWSGRSPSLPSSSGWRTSFSG